ncbi:hypothetical protein KFU94_38090 [Chloroflexi bacterium TSY]|nr:hypothetical protein [Chloroflexi bacterium TSY]
MARKNQLSGKLENNQPQGWQDQIKTRQAEAETEPKKAPTKTSTYKRKTFLMTQELIDRIQAVSERENVGQNELVRYLIDRALQQVEQGEHALPTRPGRNTLGI